MSCYSTDFKDREGRRKATLESWEKFNYLDLSYDLKEHSISTDTAQAYVEWLMRISPKIGGKPQESKTVLDVTLKREDGSWRIKETRLVS
jgi:ketosteroid isomerase-like protein